MSNDKAYQVAVAPGAWEISEGEGPSAEDAVKCSILRVEEPFFCSPCLTHLGSAHSGGG